eukprot:jgi/Botrbrau1/15577/Bobra.33_1s0006.1
MIIAVFGATGDTGKLVVEYALQDGHKVQLLARDPKRLPKLKEDVFSSSVKVTVGTISDDDAVEEVVKGANAVIETLSAGSPGNLPGTVKRDGVAAIIRAMKNQKVKRLIVLSTGGLSPEWHKQMPAFLQWSWPFFFKYIDDDSGAAEEAVMAEAGYLEFTILRPPLLLMGVPALPQKDLTLSEGSPAPGTNAVPVANVAKELLHFAIQPVHHNEVVHINSSVRVKASFSAYRKARQLMWANIQRKIVVPALLVAASLGLAVLGAKAVHRYRIKS